MLSLFKISIFADFSPPPRKAGRYDFSPRSSAKIKFSIGGSPQDFSDDDDDDDDDDDEHQSKWTNMTGSERATHFKFGILEAIQFINDGAHYVSFSEWSITTPLPESCDP